MSRNEFMMQLEWLLEDVAEEEKRKHYPIIEVTLKMQAWRMKRGF